jgi:hypothetical protein
MIFQLFDFGPLSAKLQQYADLQGLIPSLGDRWQDFHWSRSIHRLFSDQVNGEEYWQQFIRQAMSATDNALEMFEELHESRDPP